MMLLSCGNFNLGSGGKIFQVRPPYTALMWPDVCLFVDVHFLQYSLTTLKMLYCMQALMLALSFCVISVGIDPVEFESLGQFSAQPPKPV